MRKRGGSFKDSYNKLKLFMRAVKIIARFFKKRY